MKTLAAAIEFGTSKIVVLVGESSGRHRCELVGVGEVHYAGYYSGRWNEEEALDVAIKEAITKAEEQAGHKINELFVGVPGEFLRVITRVAELPLNTSRRVTAQDVDDLLEAAKEGLSIMGGEIIHTSPAYFIADDGKSTMEPVGIKAGKIKAKVSFVVADAAFLHDMTARLSAMEFTLSGFLSPSLGCALLMIPPEERDHIAVLIDVGYLQTEMMAVQGDALVFHDCIAIGGAHITVDTVYGMQVSMEVAEQIKRRYLFGPAVAGTVEVDGEHGPLAFSREEVSKYLEPRVEELAQIIGDTLRASGIALGARSNYYLTGGGIALMRGGREFVAQVLDKPLKAPLPHAAKLDSPVYASALGLMDLVFEQVEAENQEKSSILDFFKNLIGH